MIKLIFLLPLFIFAQKPKLLLLKTYKNQDISGWVMSEKLDGIRAYWNGKQLISRGGKQIYAPAWFTKGFPTFEIDGELWTKCKDFENISSIVRDKKPSEDWKQIKYYIFEVPHSKGNLTQRYEKVQAYQGKVLKLVKQIEIKNKAHLQSFLKKILSLGGEGVVVRDASVSYINHRTNKALKVKVFKDAECEVIGYTQGKGKFEGLVGALKCRLDNNITFKVGSGLKRKERENPPKIGSRITFKYQNITKYGKPRFPVYLRGRE